MDGSASSCLGLMKTVGTLGIGILELSEVPVDALDSPPSMSSLWLGFAVVIHLTALLYMTFWFYYQKFYESLHLDNVHQIQPNMQVLLHF